MEKEEQEGGKDREKDAKWEGRKREGEKEREK